MKKSFVAEENLVVTDEKADAEDELDMIGDEHPERTEATGDDGNALAF